MNWDDAALFLMVVIDIALTYRWSRKWEKKGFNRGRSEGYVEGFASAKGIYSNRGPAPDPRTARAPSPVAQKVALDVIQGKR